MTDLQREIIRAMDAANCNAAEVGRMVGKSRNAVCYHLDQIQGETGLDPRMHADLVKLIGMVSGSELFLAEVRKCARCGEDLRQGLKTKTRIIVLYDERDGNTECTDVNLCIGCAAKVIAFARGNGRERNT